MGAMDWLFGTPEKTEQLSTKTEGQNDYLAKLLEGLSQGKGGIDSNSNKFLNSLLSGDESVYKQFEDPFKRQFNQEVIPEIAERFVGRQDSSAFQNALRGSGEDLAAKLAANRGDLMTKAASQLGNQEQNYGNMALNANTFENLIRGGDEGALSGILQGLAGGLGGALGAGVNPFAGIGSLLSGFGNKPSASPLKQGQPLGPTQQGIGGYMNKPPSSQYPSSLNYGAQR